MEWFNAERTIYMKPMLSVCLSESHEVQKSTNSALVEKVANLYNNCLS